MSIETQVREYIVQNFLLGQEAALNPTESLLETGVFDSTGVLEMVTFLERTFRIKVEDEDLVPENLDSIHSITAFVERKLGTSPSALAADAEPDAEIARS